jgi:uncharacterized repeat protein (TIGR04076 family)
MERRSFIKKSIAASACTLAGATSSPAAEPKKTECKITVLKRTVQQDLYQEIRQQNGRPCPVFQDGQEFEVKSQYRMPEGFCQWAWADIRPFIQAVWHGREDAAVTCCTDGFRPVIMKIARE